MRTWQGSSWFADMQDYLSGLDSCRATKLREFKCCLAGHRATQLLHGSHGRVGISCSTCDRVARLKEGQTFFMNRTPEYKCSNFISNSHPLSLSLTQPLVIDSCLSVSFCPHLLFVPAKLSINNDEVVVVIIYGDRSADGAKGGCCRERS